MSKELAREAAQEVLEVCKVEEGGTDDDVKKLLKLEWPGNEAGNCMIACAHEKTMIYKDGVFNRQAYDLFVKLVTEGEEQYMTLGAELGDKCGGVTGSRCEQAVNFDKCIEDELVERKVDIYLL
jgi:hypothetical protein